MNIDTLKFIRGGGETTRFHTMRVIHQETVGQHSFGVAWLCYLLTDGAPSATLLLHALAHDLAEHVTGDMPGPAKRAMGIREVMQEFEDVAIEAAGIELPPLNGTQLKVLKIADALDGMLACCREKWLGNRGAEAVYYKFLSYVTELVYYDDPELYGDVLDNVGIIWAEGW